MIQRTMEIGPIHPCLPGAMKLGLGLEGDRIQTCDIELGYQVKNVKEKMIGRDLLWSQAPFSHLEPEQAMVLDTLFSEAVEEGFGFECSERAQWIREVSINLSDVSMILRYLATMAKAMGTPILMNIVLKHREDLLDLIELLSGSRYAFGYIVPGGSRYDLSEGFCERFEKWAKQILLDLPRIEAFFFWSPEYVQLLKDQGALVDLGMGGFLSASSTQTSRVGSVTSVYSRVACALDGLRNCVKNLQAQVVMSPDGNFFGQLSPKKGKQSGSGASLESFRGSWKLNLAWDSDLKVTEMTCVTPSHAMIQVLGSSLEGEMIDHMGVVLQSMFFRVSEVDQ